MLRLLMIGASAGARVVLPSLSRRALLRGGAVYVGVPLALDSLITVVGPEKMSENAKAFTVVAGTAIAAYGPMKFASLVKSAATSPAALSAAVRGAGLAMSMKTGANYAAAAALLRVVRVSVVAATATAGRKVIIDLPKYGKLTFLMEKGKLTVSGSTAGITGAVLAGGLIAATATLTMDDVEKGALQIATALLHTLREAERDEVKEQLFKADPLSLFASLPIIGDALAREFPLVTRQEIAALAIDSLAEEVFSESGLVFDAFTDADGDAILEIDGTAFKIELPSSVTGFVKLDAVAAAQRAQGELSPAEHALVDLVRALCRDLYAMGKIPFIKGDDDLLISPPTTGDLNGEEAMAAMTVSDSGQVGFIVTTGNWFESAEGAISVMTTRNFLERALDSSIAAGEVAVDTASEFADFIGKSLGLDDDPQPVEIINRDSRLEVKPGEVVYYNFSEIEEVL